MTFVYDSNESEIKREPTKQERELVAGYANVYRQLQIRFSTIPRETRMKYPEETQRLWDAVVAAEKLYAEQFNKYIGYCYH